MENMMDILGKILPVGEPSCSQEEAALRLCELKAKTGNKMPGDLNENIRSDLYGYDCQKCQNKGYVLSAREGAIVSNECECMPIRRNLRRLRRSGLQDQVGQYTFDAFTAREEWQKRLRDMVESYVDDARSEDCGWMFIGGQSGAGKTHICTAACAAFINRGMDTRYMIWRDELRRLKAVANTPEYADCIGEFSTCKVLYIDDFYKAGKDDLGRTKVTQSDIAISFEILNRRYTTKGIITIISSELRLDQIADIDEATAGRIAQKSKDHCMTIKADRKRNYRLKGVVEL